jgi:hypothetical protein
MTAAAFLDEEQESAESFLDAPAPAPTASAEDFLDQPENTGAPILLDDRFPTGQAIPAPLEPLNLFAPDPDELPAPIDIGADQANAIAREATADSEARRGIFSPDSPPYRLLGDQMAIDPLRYDDAAGELWKEGLIDSEQYFRMMNDAGDIKTAAAARRDLELEAGRNPQLKSALYGFGKGALQTAAAIGVGGSTGAATAPAIGPGAIPAGIAAGVGSAILVGDIYDTFAEKLAAEDENIASLLAARELHPGYDIGGQLSSILIPTPFALSRLKTASSLIATERGTAEAAKFVARVTGTGAGIGLGTDLAVQGGMAAIDLASDRPVSFSPESLAISTTLGALTSGLGVRSNNRVYMADELPILEQRVKLGTASREDAADYWTMRRTIEILREDQRLLEAGAIARSTVDFMGTRVLDTNTVINPRFQRDILTQAGFEPPFSSTNQPPAPSPITPGRPALPYAAENPAAAVPAPASSAAAYTGQAFLNRGGPAPAFQGGTTALPGPEGIQALPGPLPEPPAVPPVAPPTEPPTVSDQVDYFAGDKIQYTGGQAPEGFREFVYLEGPKAGTTGVARTPEAKATDLANARRIFEEEQAALKRLRESGESDQMPKSPTKPTPKLQAAAATPEPVRQSQPVDPSVMRDQKKFLVSEIDRLLAEAPDITPAEAGLAARPDLAAKLAELNESLKTKQGPAYHQATKDIEKVNLEAAQAAPKVTIEIPGDGVFTIHNTKQTLTDFAAKAKSFPSTVSRPAVPAKPASSSSQIPAVATKPEDWNKAVASFAYKGGDRASIDHVWQNSEVTVATDGRMLMISRSGGKPPAKVQGVRLGSSSDEGWILNPKTLKPVSKESILTYPDWRQILPGQDANIPLAEVDAGQLLVPVNQARAVLSSETEETSRVIELVVNPDFTIGVAAKAPPADKSAGDEFNHNVQPGAKPIGRYQADRLRALIGGMRSTGQSMFRIYSTPSESELNPLVVENGNAFGVLMPMRSASQVPVSAETKHLPARIRDQSKIFWPSITPSPPAKKAKSLGSKSKADLGPQGVAATPPAAAPPRLPPLAERNDAQIFADYPSAVAVHRGPGWAVPVILGGTDKIPVFQSPEIVEFYRTLAMKDPTLKNFSNALGRFYSDTGRVAVRPDLFQDENSALMTLSHEIGHFWSWADEGEIRLGNLGGHIQNIHNFLKTAFPIDKAGGPIITAQERRKLYNQARKSMPQGSKPEQDDPGLADWQAEVASRYRELIQELMDSRRLAYVGPRRGGFEDGAYDPNIREELISVSEWWKPFDYDTVPDSYLRYRHSAAELFADAISVLFMSPADLKQRAPTFWEALFNHMDSRPQVKAKYLDIANRVLRGREAVLDHRISRDMQNFAKADEIFMSIHGEAAARRASISGLRDDILDQFWDQYYPITSAIRAAEKQGKITFAEDDPFRYLTEEHPLSDSVVQLAMADMGRIMLRLDEAGIPRYELDMYLKDSRIAFEKQEIQAEVDGIMQAVGWEGSATKANPDGETPTTAADKLARQAELLGPEKTALLKATAAQWRDIFHDVVRRAWEKGVLTDEAWQKFDSNDSYATFTVLKHIRDFGSARIVGRKGTFQAVGRPSVEMMKKMVALHREAQRNEFRSVMVPRLRESLPEVVRDAPMKFNGKAMVPQQPLDRGWELITWREKGQLRGVHIQTRWARAFQINSPGIENGILRALNTGFRETIYNLIIRYNPSFQLGTGPVMDFTRSLRNMPGGVKGRVAFLKEMTREVFELAKSRDGRRVLLEGAGSLGGIVTGGPAGAVVGAPGGPAGMALGGVVGANTAGAAGFYLGRMVASIVERALPWLPDDPTASVDWARGDFGRNALIRDMIENYAISGPWNYVGRGMTADPDDSMGALFAKFTQAGKPDSSNFLWKHLKNLFQDIEFAGQALQLIPKSAAYRVMSDKLGIPKRQSAYWIRNHIGLPNTAKKGGHIRNVEAVLPFANVWVRSLESMGKLMSGMDAKNMSAREWWMAFLLGGGGLWAVLQALASEGYFGEDIEKTYAGASEYVKSNLVAIPLGTVPSPTGDKSALLTVPLDHESRVLFGLIYKATRAGLRASQGKPLDVGLPDLVTGFAATTPGVNPFLDVAGNWADLSMGKTPIDHRNLPILTDDERRVGGTAALGPMLGWTLEETGVANFFKYDPKANTFTEAALKPMPSINRFLRITDAGTREAERKTMDEEQRVRSQFKLGFPSWIQALRSEASYLQRKGDARSTDESMRHIELKFWRRQYDKALDNMETAHELGNKAKC